MKINWEFFGFVSFELNKVIILHVRSGCILESKDVYKRQVFGGLDSGTTEQTVDVFLESAYFNPTWVRKTARRHGLDVYKRQMPICAPSLMP